VAALANSLLAGTRSAFIMDSTRASMAAALFHSR